MSPLTRYAIYGAAGYGRGVMPLLREQLESSGEKGELLFVDDDRSRQTDRVNGVRCISFDQLIAGDIASTRIAIAVADSNIRKKLMEKCQIAGLRFFEVTAKNHIRYDRVDIAPGAIFCAHTSVTSNVSVGAHFHCNIYSYVEHDCVIGDFVTFAPRVSCNGNVVIEDGAYIGTGAVLKQGTPERPLRIGKAAVVGMGAVVIRDVAPGSTVVGNPARPLASPGPNR